MSESQQTNFDSLIGSIPSHWRQLPLGDVCKLGGGNIQTGPFGSQLHASDYVPSGIPSVMPQNIGDNRIVETDVMRITPQDAKRLSRYLLEPGDIVYSRRGDIERRALVREHENGWLCGTGCLRVRLGSGHADPLFTSYYLGHPQVRAWLIRHAVGATMPNLNTSILSALPFVLPPLETQRAIAHILGTLDDKIELNRRMNKTLEDMAKAIFKSWFVDFDPVRAKAEGWQPEGMDAETATLFPDGFEDSELGEIPRGWTVNGLDEIAQFLNGLALQKFPPDGEDDLPVIKIAQLRKGDTIGADMASNKVGSQYIIQDGDILFSWSGSLEAVIWVGGRGALNQHLFKVTSNNYPKWFYFLWVRHHLPSFRAIASNKATTMGHIQRHHLSEAKVVIPSEPVLALANKHLKPIHSQLLRNSLEFRTLAALRDELLPKLISGELSVAAPLLDEVLA